MILGEETKRSQDGEGIRTSDPNVEIWYGRPDPNRQRFFRRIVKQRCQPPLRDILILLVKPSDMRATCREHPTPAFSPSFAYRLSASIGAVGVHRRNPMKASQPQSQLRRTIRRHQLHEIVPLADSTIYAMEQRGEFPRRFALSPRCVVWDLAEVEAWLSARRTNPILQSRPPDVTKRKTRPVKARGQASSTPSKGG